LEEYAFFERNAQDNRLLGSQCLSVFLLFCCTYDLRNYTPY